jgi:hypothetical protein
MHPYSLWLSPASQNPCVCRTAAGQQVGPHRQEQLTGGPHAQQQALLVAVGKVGQNEELPEEHRALEQECGQHAPCPPHVQRVVVVPQVDQQLRALRVG